MIISPTWQPDVTLPVHPGSPPNTNTDSRFGFCARSHVSSTDTHSPESVCRRQGGLLHNGVTFHTEIKRDDKKIYAPLLPQLLEQLIFVGKSRADRQRHPDGSAKWLTQKKVLLLTARTLVNTARFDSGAASRAEDSCTAEADRSSDVDALHCTRVRPSVRPSGQETSRRFCIFCRLFTHSLLSLFVCAAFCVHSCACAAYPSGSVAAALWTRIRRRTSAPTPRRALRPAPLLASSHGAIASEAERMKKGGKKMFFLWPMVTQTLFPYAHSRSRCLRHPVMRKKIVIRDALFVSKMVDVLGLLLGIYLYLKPCTRWKTWSYFKKSFWPNMCCLDFGFCI